MSDKPRHFRIFRRLWDRPQWIGPAVILLLWFAVYHFELANRALLPDVLSTLKHLVRMVFTGNILADYGETLGRMSLGYAIAALVGIPLGVCLGSWKRGYASFEVVLEFFRSLPVTTLYPLFVLFFGIGHQSKIAMVVAACVFVIILNSAYGVLHAKQTRLQVAQVFGANRWQVFREILLFESLPQTIIGLRVAMSYALIVEIVCEMFMGAQRGIGQRVFEAYNTYDIVELYAIIILVGLTGYGINKLFVAIERPFTHWVGK